MIVWAGPMGLFENKHFETGTREIANAIANNAEAFKIVGGGDTLNAVSKYNLIDKFDHVSTGGSAMLSFLSKETLPGIEALNKG
jgi:3-phosphoglycerate kinase